MKQLRFPCGLVLSLGLVGVALAGGARPATGARGAKASQPPADEAFGAFADRYFDGLFHFYPDRATSAGLHQYDSELLSYSRREIEAERRLLRSHHPHRRNNGNEDYEGGDVRTRCTCYGCQGRG